MSSKTVVLNRPMPWDTLQSPHVGTSDCGRAERSSHRALSLGPNEEGDRPRPRCVEQWARTYASFIGTNILARLGVVSPNWTRLRLRANGMMVSSSWPGCFTILPRPLGISVPTRELVQLPGKTTPIFPRLVTQSSIRPANRSPFPSCQFWLLHQDRNPNAEVGRLLA